MSTVLLNTVIIIWKDSTYLGSARCSAHGCDNEINILALLLHFSPDWLIYYRPLFFPSLPYSGPISICPPVHTYMTYRTVVLD
jgi:hypothetical protein